MNSSTKPRASLERRQVNTTFELANEKLSRAQIVDDQIDKIRSDAVKSAILSDMIVINLVECEKGPYQTETDDELP